MRKKLIAYLTLAAMLICMFPLSALAATESSLKPENFEKTTYKSQTLNFTLADFTEHFNDTSSTKLPLDGIIVTMLPSIVSGSDPDFTYTLSGTLRVGTVPVVANQIIPRDSLASLNYVPANNVPANEEPHRQDVVFQWQARAMNNGVPLISDTTSTVTISIIDPPPVAKDETLEVYLNTAKTSRFPATDERKRPLTYSITRLPTNGTVTNFNPVTGDFTYTPKNNYLTTSANEDEEFINYKVVVTAGGADAQEDTGKLTIKVTSPAPEAVDSTVNVTMNMLTKANMQAKDVRAREITFEPQTAPTNGTFTLIDPKTGLFSYMPNKGFSGTDEFTFRVVADNQKSNIATVTLKVGNAPEPMAYADLVSPWDWAAYSAGMLGTHGVVIGEKIGGKNFFYPGREIKRADFIVMMCSAFDIAPEANTTSVFNDKDMPSWLIGYANAAYKANLINGDTVDGEMLLYPNQIISRVEAVKVIDGALKVAHSSIDIPFSDIMDIPQWGIQPVRNMYQYGIIKGNADGTLRPHDKINRAEAAEIIYQAYKYNLMNPRTNLY